MKCDWPRWETCTNELNSCNKTTCCLDEFLAFSYTNAGTDDGRHGQSDEFQMLLLCALSADFCIAGDVTYIGQYDPRYRPWYFETIDKWADTGQTQSFTSPFMTRPSNFLAMSATMLIPGYSGADGQDATSGTYVGGCFAGADFNGHEEQLVLFVDGTEFVITFSTDLADINVAVQAINVVALGAAVSSETADHKLMIRSSSIGAASSVRIGPSSGSTIQGSFCDASMAAERAGPIR